MNPATLKKTAQRNAKRFADAVKTEEEAARRREATAKKKYQLTMRPAVLAMVEAAIMAAVDQGAISTIVTFSDISDRSGYLSLAWELDEMLGDQGFSVSVWDSEYTDPDLYAVTVEIGWE